MAQKNKDKIEFRGRKRLIDVDTGEVNEFDAYVKKVGRNEPFMISYMQEIMKFIDVLGNRKMAVVKYVFKHMTKADNSLRITTVELAKKVGVSRQTVSDTLKILEQAKLIKRKVGIIMVNPRLMNNKSAENEARMMIEFVREDE